MPQTMVQVRTIHNGSAALGWTGSHAVAIDRTEAGGGLGIGFSGGDLLLLAIGGCYCNDVYREAAKLGIVVRSVSVEVGADWGGDPVRAQNVTLSARVEAEASETRIRELLEHTDRVAEIPNTLRLGTPVRLTTLEAVSISE